MTKKQQKALIGGALIIAALVGLFYSRKSSASEVVNESETIEPMALSGGGGGASPITDLFANFLAGGDRANDAATPLGPDPVNPTNPPKTASAPLVPPKPANPVASPQPVAPVSISSAPTYAASTQTRVLQSEAPAGAVRDSGGVAVTSGGGFVGRGGTRINPL